MTQKRKLGTFYTDDGAVIDHVREEKDAVLYIVEVLTKALGEIALNISYYWKSRKHVRKGRVTLPLEYETKNERDKKLGELMEKLMDPLISTQIALISPRNTISILKNGKVLSEDSKEYKWNAHIPDEIKGLVRCPNDNCITNEEDVPLRVYYTEEGHVFRCHYCDTRFGFEVLMEKKLLTYLD